MTPVYYLALTYFATGPRMCCCKRVVWPVYEKRDWDNSSPNSDGLRPFETYEIIPLSESRIEEAEELVKGVVVRDDEDLPDDVI